MKVAVLGGGSMGVACAALLSKNGHEVSIWTPVEAEAKQIQETHGIAERLPGVTLPETVVATTSLEVALAEVGLVLLAVPSVFIRTTCRNASNALRRQGITGIPFVCCSKGLENETGLLLTDIMEEELPDFAVAVLSGPSYAIEIATGMPTAVVIASGDLSVAQQCQDVFMNGEFRVYTSTDVVGVELGGALKNVIALCAGICDGLGFGDNTKAALLTRGIAEIARLGVAMGADVQTFFGLTGMGDMILTCTGKHSRNKQAGMLLGKGYSLEDTLKEVKMVVEGVSAAKPALLLAQKYGVEMPIIEEANRVLYEGKCPREAMLCLMARDKKSEF